MSRCCGRPVATPTRWPSWPSPCSSPPPGASFPPTATSADGEIYRDGTIPYQRYRAWELAGKTVGLVGLGAVGRALRWRLRGLGMDVLAYDPYAPDATSSLDELLERSDVVSVHAPVTDGDHRA